MLLLTKNFHLNSQTTGSDDDYDCTKPYFTVPNLELIPAQKCATVTTPTVINALAWITAWKNAPVTNWTWITAKEMPL